MPYNVSSSNYLSGKLIISEQNVIEGRKWDLPGGNLLELDNLKIIEPTDMFTILELWWYGEGSGTYLDTLEAILKHTKGEADILLCFEGGDSYKGYRVKDGKVTEMDVIIRLAVP